MALREGQVIAIPVLTRHIETSSGKCVAGSESWSSNCVMADALRDRFLDAEDVSVGNSASDFVIGGEYIGLTNGADMARVISAFDDAMGRVRGGEVSIEEALASVRKAAPRVVHATVSWVGAQ